MANRNNRTSLTKAVVLVSVSFMMFSILHLNFSTDITQYSEIPSTSETTSTQDFVQPPAPNTATTTLDSDIQATTTTTRTATTTATSSSQGPKKPKTAPSRPNSNDKNSNNNGNIVYDTELSTTVQFENGSFTKIFKSAFFEDPKAAKKEMGSFMQTLATKTWLGQELATDLNNNNVNNNSEEQEVEEEEDNDPDHEVASNATSLDRFFTYLPMGGGNNQFTSLEKAAILAKDLNRTLIVPPISPNSHIRVWAGPRYSQFYDLDTFVAESGISVIEWHDVKQAPETVPGQFSHSWEEFSEEFPCIPNGGIGVDNGNLYDKFRQQFLLKFQAVVPPTDKTKGMSTNFKFARDVLLKDTPVTSNDEVDPNMWRCLSSPYFLGGDELNNRLWDEVGVHFRFNEKTEAMADDILDVLLGPVDDGDDTFKSLVETSESKKAFRPHPEFIIIHLRRGDITTKCPKGMKETDCIVQIEVIAERIDEIEKERRIAALEKHTGQERDFIHKRLPVLVATNEQRESELEKIEKLGWILLDHGDEEVDKKGNIVPSKTIKLGTESKLGPWYPPMLDAVLLTRGNYLI
ncbi:hypothetical protein BGZ49_003549, partial [Haplosporangium sp. Z 27]